MTDNNEHEVEPIAEGTYYPGEERREPAFVGPFVKGGRVEHRSHAGRLGTIIGVELHGVRVDWDMLYHETIEHPADLRQDAPMPDPAFALAKALRYRRQRDAALTDLAALAGLEVDYEARVGRALTERDDAQAEYQAALIRIEKARRLAESERDLAEGNVARQAEHIQKLERIIEAVELLASTAGGHDEAGDYLAPSSALDRIRAHIANARVDAPTESVGE